MIRIIEKIYERNENAVIKVTEYLTLPLRILDGSKPVVIHH